MRTIEENNSTHYNLSAVFYYYLDVTTFNHCPYFRLYLTGAKSKYKQKIIFIISCNNKKNYQQFNKPK